MIYNTGEVTTSAVDRLCPGLHVWDGSKWYPLVAYPTIDATKTVIDETVVNESGRTDISGTTGYEIGPLGQFTDTRGPSDVEVKQYHHARFYAYKSQATGSITYEGIRNTNICDASKAVAEQWTETGSFEHIDDGVWMTENLNTEYLTASSPAKMNRSSANSLTIPRYFSPANTGTNAAQKQQNGLLYNWAAATNGKGGSTGLGNVDNPGVLEEQHSNHKVRQGVCPVGWHLPSDKEWNELEAAYAPSSDKFTLSMTYNFTWLDSYNTQHGWRPNGQDVFGPGKGMKSTTPLNGMATDGDSKTADNGGFNILLAGYASGSTAEYGRSSLLWTSSSTYTGDDGNQAWIRGIIGEYAGLWRVSEARIGLLSIRCKRN